MILIGASPNDPHAAAVEQELALRGALFLRFHFSRFPTRSEISVSFGRGNSVGSIRVGDREIHFSEVRSVWFRRPGVADAGGNIASKNLRTYIEGECSKLLASLEFFVAPGCWTPGSSEAITTAELKPLQLLCASRLGLEIPTTVIGNDPARVKNELLGRSAQFVVKCLYSGYFESELTLLQRLKKKAYEIRHRRFFQAVADDPEATDYYKYTSSLNLLNESIDRDEMNGRLDYIPSCPVIVQEYIEKQFEVRVTVVGKKAFACAIHSQQHEKTRADWRVDAAACRHEPYQLPVFVEERCLKLTADLGLNFGCIDLIVTPDGRHVFLEINPMGQWLWVERATKLPIASAIADLLMPGDRSSSVDGPNPAPV